MQQKLTADQEYVREFIPFVDFLADILGPNSEVVLNDLLDLNHSVVAIRNSHISHRKVGDPATDLALRTMKAGDAEKREYLANYKGVSHGDNTLRSSTFFLRQHGEVVGMICINTDDSVLDNLQQQVIKVLTNYKHLDSPTIYKTKVPTTDKRETVSANSIESEHLTTSIGDLAKEVTQSVCARYGISVDYLKRDDKLEIVRNLYHQGYFLLKDSVSEVAKVIKVSDPSVYRYLQIVKDEELQD
ncbi:helix-turn-helix transcriptional regulator [Levilactobacillus enshiensis]|uniref:helix-turn-helix transcriptional regulator n=1 Tax=Levilactobacillus enshiensis TaxID=2590213 RepID=UPI00117B8C02|nr:PAS domain-containing protein [Levilactobacillus enshiensis]